MSFTIADWPFASELNVLFIEMAYATDANTDEQSQVGDTESLTELTDNLLLRVVFEQWAYYFLAETVKVNPEDSRWCIPLLFCSFGSLATDVHRGESQGHI